MGRKRKLQRGEQLDNTITGLTRRPEAFASGVNPWAEAPRSFVKIRLWKTMLILFVLFGCLTIFLPYSHAAPWQVGQGPHRAALIDSLSATDPDPFFISNVTRSLSTVGFSVDYFGPSQVTVDLFRTLPLRGYSILMFRTHTATGPLQPPGQNIVTHQNYTTAQFSFEQLTSLVSDAIVRPGNQFFAITPAFISDESAGVGGFHGALIIQMGCSTLQAQPDLATAYYGRGAGAFVGWNGIVSSYYTDIATENFLASLIHGKTIQQAVAGASSPDPDYGGQLTYLDPASVSQQLMINQSATVVIWLLILAPALFIARRQGFLDFL